ncbi:hypothetical protein [Actinomyces bowdenii]|uniref:Uncharacterized protein n=1 Tax=Actinomyces bowdenii TaxID=131109 RepID=A0A3P1V977_9ACTO|nr:hypothetical protein [Actinomyces bowdenii]RRD30762.1 hypothetical protein EII10_01200 [Actinomyces bowdenii]
MAAVRPAGRRPASACAVALALGCLVLSACSGSGATDAAEAGAAAASTETAPATSASTPAAGQGASAPASAPAQGQQTLSPALGRTMTISQAAVSEEPTAFKDGLRQVIYHVDTDAPYSVFVEYYPNGEKAAADILASEQEVFSSQGVEVTVSATTVEGGSNAQRMDWTQEGDTAWSATDPSGVTTLTGAAVFVDGQDGYAYSVYAYGPSDNGEAVAAAHAVLDSLVVSAP